MLTRALTKRPGVRGGRDNVKMRETHYYTVMLLYCQSVSAWFHLYIQYLILCMVLHLQSPWTFHRDHLDVVGGCQELWW